MRNRWLDVRWPSSRRHRDESVECALRRLPASSMVGRISRRARGVVHTAATSVSGTQRFRAILALSGVATFSGCRDSGPIAPPNTPSIFESVVGAAAGALGPDGTFIEDDPLTFGPDSILTRARVSQLASAFLTEFGPSFAGDWSSAVGYEIRPSELRPCGHVQFIDSPFQPITDSVSWTSRKAYGPRFWAPFCGAGSRTVLLVAVAALATDVKMLAGRLQPSADILVSFAASPVPSDWTVPFDAEGVAVATFALTGVRVQTVPRAGARASGLPFFAVWDDGLERPVVLQDVLNSASRRSQASLLMSDDGRRGIGIFRRDTLSVYPGVSTISDPSGGGSTFQLQLRSEAQRLLVQVTPIQP